MTRTQREQWDTKTLDKIRKHLRTNLAILTFTSADDKREIESEVMAEMQKVVAKTLDRTIEDGSWMCSFDLEADSLALSILEEQQMERDFDWGF